MRKKSLLLIAASSVIFTVFIAAGIQAGTMGPDVIEMESEGYTDHKRGIVTFYHNKHVVEYDLECGKCHHDEDGEPVPSFEMGKADASCSKCHELDTTHETHTQDYELSCGECHTDEEGNPMEDFTAASCISCHEKPGLSPKGVSLPRLSKDERLEYHGEAVHEMCRECHKQVNKEKQSKAAPTACNKCHPSDSGHDEAAEQAETEQHEEEAEKEEAH